uniref:Uncharacterized protein n=1 Tax=Oryza brachyantha TaxID=4533 RepID=J3KVD8_ORYBR
MGIESFFPVQVAAWLETIGPGAFERNICVNSSLHAPPFPSTIGAHPLPCSLPPPQRRQTCDGGKLVAVAVAVAASQERSPARYPTPLPSSALPSTIDGKVGSPVSTQSA